MKKIGVTLLTLGLAVYVLYGAAGLIQHIFSPRVPVLFKIAFVLVAGGAAVIIISLIKENSSKKDRYEEVEK